LRIFFRNQLISNKNCLWWTCLLTDRDEMSNLYRGPSIAATYQVSVHLAKRFQRRIFFYELTNQLAMIVNGSKMSNLYRGPSIDATYHVSIHLAKRFQSRRFFRNRPISNNNCLCRPCLLDPK
jgi:hypothetical protein